MFPLDSFEMSLNPKSITWKRQPQEWKKPCINRTDENSSKYLRGRQRENPKEKR